MTRLYTYTMEFVESRVEVSVPDIDMEEEIPFDALNF